jgi:hypothetical protein
MAGLTIDQLQDFDDTIIDAEEIVFEVEQKNISTETERSRKMSLKQISEEINPFFEVFVDADYDWYEEYGTWIAEIEVVGIRSTDRPIVDINITDAESASEEQVQWSKVFRIEASDDNEIKLYAFDAPTVDFNLFIQVIR